MTETAGTMHKEDDQPMNKWMNVKSCYYFKLETQKTFIIFQLQVDRRHLKTNWKWYCTAAYRLVYCYYFLLF